MGAQASIIRMCLDLLPIDKDTAFVDIGCGKGRAAGGRHGISVRQDRWRRAVIGRGQGCSRNARKMAARFPDKTKIEIVEGDATTYRLGYEAII